MKTSIDENKIFREVTLLICGNLHLEEALYDCIKYLKDYIPLERLVASTFDPETLIVRDLAVATLDEGTKVSKIDSIYTENSKGVIEIISSTKLVDGFVVNSSNEFGDIFNISMKNLAERQSQIKNNSVNPAKAFIAVPLRVDGVFIGAVIAFSSKEGVFNDNHLEILKIFRDPFSLAITNAINYQKIEQLKDQLVDDNIALRNSLTKISGDEVVGSNNGLLPTIKIARQVAPMSSPVLLLGETGVGKEVIANFIHNRSTRDQGPIIRVNCGALPSSLIESELFGHEKGAFTGAASLKRGYFERANKGTIFLDEIGELPLEAQVKILRVLQEKVIIRVGGQKEIKIDVRIVAATHRDLNEMVAEKKFREDLWYRLNVVPISIPALREHREDIPLLVEYFVSRKSKELNMIEIPQVGEEAMELLLTYDWPGNIRELQNVIERAIILCQGGTLSFDTLSIRPKSLENKNQQSSINYDIEGDVELSLDEIIKKHIEMVLKKSKGRVEGPFGAAKRLDVNPSTLRSKMRKLGILASKN